MSQFTPEQWAALPESTKKILSERGMAPQQSAPAPQQLDQPPASPPGLPDLDDIPEQGGSGPSFLPFAEYDIEAVIDQVQHRFSQRSGPNFYATLTVTKASEQAVQAGVVEGTTRALYWPYNPNAFGKEADKSRASLGRYRQFVRQVAGLPEGSKEVNAKSAELLGTSKQAPSLGIRVRVISIRGSEMKQAPGKYFYNQTFIPLS
jgi:hypothetical protein